MDALITRVPIDVVAHDAALATEAKSAFLRYGKGRHPAGLNLGGCASYALAKSRTLPLLFKGNDFSATDLATATGEQDVKFLDTSRGMARTGLNHPEIPISAVITGVVTKPSARASQLTAARRWVDVPLVLACQHIYILFLPSRMRSMGARGAIIMSFFGAVFASMTLALQMGCRGPLLLSPFMLIMGVSIFSIHTIRLPGEGIVPSGPARRVILWSTVGEGIGIFIVANAAIKLGYPRILLPVMALVVGLQFLPMNYGIPFPQFYLMGSLIILSGLVGLSVNQPLGGTTSDFWSAIVLLLAAAMAVHRDRSARMASPSRVRYASLDQ